MVWRIYHTPAEDITCGLPEPTTLVPRGQAKTEQRRVYAEPPRFGGRNLLVVLVADLAAISLEPWLCVRCGRARWS